MGEAKLRQVAQKRLLEDTKVVKLNLSDIGYVVAPGDAASLTQDDTPLGVGVTRWFLTQVISAAYKDGIDRRDGKLWAGWQEVLNGKSDEIDVTAGQLEWVRQQLINDAVKVPPMLAQWRVALEAYLESVQGGTSHVSE